MKLLRGALVFYVAALALTGCETFVQINDVRETRAIKIETEIAIEFCSALLGSLKRGCAVRLYNPELKRTDCVVVILPQDGEAAAHEGGHCFGYDHYRTAR